MQSPFEQLLDALGKELGTTLTPDANQVCLIRLLDDDIPIQIEEEGSDGNIAIGCILGDLQANAFRDRIFKASLYVNGSLQAGIKGFLAYGEHTNKLYLSDVLQMRYLTGEHLAKYLKLFSKHANIWIQALNSGNLPNLTALGLYYNV